MRSERPKRGLDVIVASLALAFAAVPMAVIGAAIRATMGGPVLFCQTRAGLHGQPFTLYKFRTMRQEYDAAGNLLPNSDRITRLGRLLRATSADELPELFNVLSGDLSLVGPRPLLLEYLDRYTPEQARRHEMKPGITGLAQIQGRNALSWERKLELDLAYVDQWSLWLDSKILARTAIAVFQREGINHGDGVGAPEFHGTQPSPEDDLPYGSTPGHTHEHGG
jgi:lipopolysaccharide/colanic/teichoic acid biosynthesis glycosyltransferase